MTVVLEKRIPCWVIAATTNDEFASDLLGDIRFSGQARPRTTSRIQPNMCVIELRGRDEHAGVMMTKSPLVLAEYKGYRPLWWDDASYIRAQGDIETDWEESEPECGHEWCR